MEHLKQFIGLSWDSINTLLHTSMDTGTMVAGLIGLYLTYRVAKLGYNITSGVAKLGIGVVKGGIAVTKGAFTGVGAIGSLARFAVQPGPMATLFLVAAISGATTAGLGIGEIIQDATSRPTLQTPLSNSQLVDTVRANKDVTNDSVLKQILEYAAWRDKTASADVVNISQVAQRPDLRRGWALFLGGIFACFVSSLGAGNRAEALKKRAGY